MQQRMACFDPTRMLKWWFPAETGPHGGHGSGRPSQTSTPCLFLTRD